MKLPDRDFLFKLAQFGEPELSEKERAQVALLLLPMRSLSILVKMAINK